LANAGLAEFIAADAAGYVELAVRWAGRIDELSRLRSELRGRFRESPVCDAPRFAADLLSLLVEVVRSPVTTA
jgi:predicted O-linked N-acetylglucosamine transferase (SPINDLY family)